MKYRKYFWLSKVENCTLSMDIEAAPHKPLERSLVFLVVLLWHLRLLACPPLFLFPYTKGEKGKAESSFATEEQWQRQQSHRNWRQKLFCYWRPLPKKSQRRSKVISERMPTKLIVEYHNFFFRCVSFGKPISLWCASASRVVQLDCLASSKNYRKPIDS